MNQVKLTDNECHMYREYLMRKLTLSPDWLTEDIKIQLKAEKLFNKASRDKVTLQAWCKKWLNADQQKQLNSAIRAKKSRANRKKTAGTKTVTLSHEAWLILSNGAKRDNVTLSEWVINEFG